MYKMFFEELHQPKRRKKTMDKSKVTGEQVLEYFTDRLYEHRGFLLATGWILTVTFMIVRG